MKRILAIVCMVLPWLHACGQFSVDSLMHNGLKRYYRQYIPASYRRDAAVPLVIALHGIGDTITNFSANGLEYYADTANFILAIPQAMTDPRSGASTWNSGARFLGSILNEGIDDVGFLNYLMDTLSWRYNIDPERIYVCGFSMGGFMSYRLACEIGHRIAAIASVAGTVGDTLDCHPRRAVPILQMHGIADSTVAYATNAYGISTTPTLKYFARANHCGRWPDTLHLPDLTNDGYTVDRIVWHDCKQNFGIEQFMVFGAGHVWLTNANDVDYTAEIWRFFRRYTLREGYVAAPRPHHARVIGASPNPAHGRVSVALDLPHAERVQWQLRNCWGISMAAGSQMAEAGNSILSVDFPDIAAGMYLLQLEGKSWVQTLRIVAE